MTLQTKPPHKTKVLFTRIDPRTMEAFIDEAGARGLRKCEATRQIISAWLRHPEALQIGLPPQAK